MDPDRRNILINLATGFLAAFGVTCFLCFFYLVISWTNAGPRSPDALHGLVYAHNEHGRVVYFSAFQATASALLFAVSPLLFFVAVGIAPKKNVRSRQSRFGFSMRWDDDDRFKVGRWGWPAGAMAALCSVFLIGPPIVRALNEAGIIIPF